MASPTLTLSLLLVLLLTTLTTLTTATPPQQPPQPSVFTILETYGLPKGLLPNIIESYTFSPETGNFIVNLENTCYIQFDYLVYYEKKITGTLKVGSITNLKGIQVKRLLFWFDVDEIRVDLPPSDSIYFQVGIINKKLSVDQFNTVHSCQRNVNLNRFFQLPPPVDEEISMLLTE